MDFEIKGFFGRNRKRFSKRVSAENERRARERALSLLGSEQKMPRRFIEISEINELKE